MTDLTRLRSALASLDAATTPERSLRATAALVTVARQVCAVEPPAAPTSPQDAPVASALPKVAATPGEDKTGQERGAVEVSEELALAAAEEGARARAGNDDWREDPCLRGPPARVADEARSCIGKPCVDPRWDDVVRAFVAGARWRANR